MKTPEWYASFARGIPAMTAEQKLVYLEIADCIEQLESRLAQAERERDAAVSDIRLLAEDPDFTICDCCTKSPASFLTGCSKCDFKWRGVCTENTEVD